MDLSIVILNYKTCGLLRQCLRGIFRAEPKLNFEIIVVDNDSHDGTPTVIANEFPQVRCITSSKNIGFGAGNNLGIREARGRHILVLNSDVVIFPGNLEQLVSYLDAHPTVGLVGPKLVNPDRSTQHSCYRFPIWPIPIYRRTPVGRLPFAERALNEYLLRDWDHDSEREVDWLLGACLMMRAELVKKIGVFDERFFLYFEDVDLCRRAWEAGWQVMYNPQVAIVHYHHRQSDDGAMVRSLNNPVTRVHIRSWIQYLLKYQGKSLPHVS